MSHQHEQRTLVLLKPDTVERGLVGEILQRFERVGLKIVGMKMLQANDAQAKKHYDDLGKRKGQEILQMVVDMMMSGPLVAVCLEGIESIELVRKMSGPTEPKAAQPGTIRGDYSHVSYGFADARKTGVFNLVHASANPEEAKMEIAIWFDESELLDHKPGYTKHTLYH